MRLLVDTHAFLWFLAGDSKLRASARRRLEDDGNEKFLSIASVWEMAIKLSLRKLRLEDPLEDVVTRGTLESGIVLLDISKDHAIRTATLPWHHRDPFDRLMVAQALEDDLTVLGRDAHFDAYGVRRVW
ncbi:MAG: type II toxin-antitoxin system VapC family toxin [Polyangiales bacterium]